MSDIRTIKAKNRIEDVIEETGYSLDRQLGERYWHCLSDPNLTVDLQKQTYYWEEEIGDVIGWLQLRFNWNFGSALRYLKHRITLPPEEIPHFPARPIQALLEADLALQEQTEAKDAYQANGETAWSIAESHVQAALRLAYDYPLFERILAWEPCKIILELSWIPRLFMPLSGHLAQIEMCDYCLNDFADLGTAYLACEFDADRQLLSQGICCPECQKRFLRWLQARDLVLDYKAHLARAAASR